MRGKNKVSDLNTTARAVLALTANALFDSPPVPAPEEIDWQQVYEECCHQAIPALGGGGRTGSRRFREDIFCRNGNRP